MGYQALLFCAEDKTAQLVEKVLGELEFTVVPCREPFAAVKKITTEHFDALIVDCGNEQDAALLFKSGRNSGLNQSSLLVALVEGQAGIAKAFRIGANLVLSKPINVDQSKATLRVARGLLRKAEAAKSAVPPAQVSVPSATEEAPPSAFAAVAIVGDASLPSLPAPPDVSMTSTAAAGLEVEAKEEPTPALGAAEAALIESMPEMAPQPAETSALSSSPSWSPASKSISDPSHSLPETSETKIASASKTDISARPGPAFPVGDKSAAATAPAKELSASVANLSASTATTAAAPSAPLETNKSGRSTKSTKRAAAPAKPKKDVEEQEDQPSSGPDDSKKNFAIAAVLVLGLAAAGYYEWPILQSTIMNLGIVQKYLGVKPAPVPAPPALAKPVSAPTSSTTNPAVSSPESQLSASASTASVGTGDSATQPTAAATTAPVTTATSTSQPSVAAATLPPPAANHPAADSPSPAPIVVKSDAKNRQNRKLTPPPVTLNPSENNLAVVANTPALARKPTLQSLRVSQGVSNSLLLKRVQPVYPTLALQLRVEGPVELEATVTKDGSTSNIKVVKGDAMLSRAAVDAVRQWKYKPYLLDGQPVELQTQITVNFKLPI